MKNLFPIIKIKDVFQVFTAIKANKIHKVQI